MAMSASSFLSSSTLCTKERSPVTTKFSGTRWAVRNQNFSNQIYIKRGFLRSMVRTNSSRVYPRLQASLSTGGAAITTEKLNQEFGCLGVTVVNGEGNLPKIVLNSSVGSEVEIYTFGGCVTSWKTSNGKDLLFVRPDAVFNGQKPISGGIPHCFPQFGPGPMQQHGFARNMTWSVVSSANSEGNPTIVLELKDNAYTHSMWDFNFLATYKVALNSDSLSTELLIKNTDNKPFSFTAALHTYFHASVTGVLVKGLEGCKTLNKFPDPQNPIEGLEEREVVNFPGFVDCIYNDAPNKLQLENGLGDTIAIENRNWADAVLWNPHMTMEACYRDFVCVENAKIGKVELQPGQSWTGEQCLSAR